MHLLHEMAIGYLNIMSESDSSEILELKNGKIFVAGHNGMVGSAMVRRLQLLKCKNLVLRNRDQLDLTQQVQVNQFFRSERPDFVILAAAKVGGIYANNTYPAQFIYNNLAISTNVIAAAHHSAVKRLHWSISQNSMPIGSPLIIGKRMVFSHVMESFSITSHRFAERPL